MAGLDLKVFWVKYMAWAKKIPVLAMLVLVFGSACAFAEFYLKPGDSGEFSFTVINSSDSVGALPTPQVVYPNKPSWFSMDNVSMVAYDSLRQGTSCLILMDYTIADNAPSAIANLDFKVIFSIPNIDPRVWYPAGSHKLVVDASPPSISINHPEWRNSPAATTLFSSIVETTVVVRGIQADFTAFDGESGIDNFQIANSSGENISAEYFTQSLNTASFGASFAEDVYTIYALNKAGDSTSGQVYVDYTPTVAVDSFITQEDVPGVYSDDISLTALSRWGLVYVKLLPNTSAYSDSSGLDAAAALREYDAGGASSTAFTFNGVPSGEYVLYAKNLLGSISSIPLILTSTTTFNSGTGLYSHSVQYANPGASSGGGTEISLNVADTEKVGFQIDYDSISLAGITTINTFPVTLPQDILGTAFPFPYGMGFNITAGTAFTGFAHVKVTYRESLVSESQQAGARLYSSMDGVNWSDITESRGAGWVEGKTNYLSKIVLVFPYTASQPYVAQSTISVNGIPAAELVSYSSSAAIAVIDVLAAPMAAYISANKSTGDYLISDVFALSPSGAELLPPGQLALAFSADYLRAISVPGSALKIKCASANGFETIPAMSVDSSRVKTAFSKLPAACAIFSTVEPGIPDTLAPESAIQYSGSVYYSSWSYVYLGPTSNIAINSHDVSASSIPLSGVKTIYFAVMPATVAAAAYDANDFSKFIIYNSTFNLLDGVSVVSYFALDNAGNKELLKQATVYVDYTGPISSVLQNSGQFVDGMGVLYAAPSSQIMLGSEDQEYGGVVSGVAGLRYLLDINRADCPPDTPYNSQGPGGTCENPVYAPFMISGGSRTLYYWGEDNVGNIESENSIAVYVDSSAPETSGHIDGIKIEDLDNVLLPEGSSITLTATDILGDGMASGVKKIMFLLDVDGRTCGPDPTYTSAPGTCDNPVYSGPFSVSAGTHTVSFFAVDNVGNYGQPQTMQIRCSYDFTAPIPALAVNGTPLENGAEAQITPSDAITVTAEDPVVNGRASGVKDIYYLIDVTTDSCQAAPVMEGPPGTCLNPLYAGPFTLDAGPHTVYYTAEDNAGNMAAVKSVRVEVTAPVVIRPPKGYEFGKTYLSIPNTNSYYSTFDLSGNSYLTKTPSPYILKFSSSGALISQWGSYGTGPGQFGDISGIQVGLDGNIYAADMRNNNVQIFTPEGVYLSEIKGSFDGPTDIKFDKSGNLYVANYFSNQIVVVSSGGAVINRISASRVSGLALDDNGNIFACNSRYNIIYKFDSAGNLLFQIGPGAGSKNLYWPFGIDTDYFGNFYVADMFNGRIVVFSNNGGYIGEFGTKETTPDGVLRQPAGIRIKKESGEVFVNNYDNTTFASEILLYRQKAEDPLKPAILSPLNDSKIFSNNVLIFGRATPGEKINILDSGLLVGATHVYEKDGSFKTFISLPSGRHAISAEAVSNLGFASERTSPVGLETHSLQVPTFLSPSFVSVKTSKPYDILRATTTVAGDFNGDGKMDLFLPGAEYYGVLLGNGDGTFRQLPPVYMYEWSVLEGKSGDYNNDGFTDISLAARGEVAIAMGNGDGTFRPLQKFYGPPYSGVRGLENADLNKDGYTDIITAFGTGEGYVIRSLMGSADGNFLVTYSTAVDTTGLASPWWLYSRDFDKDGKLDALFGGYIRPCRCGRCGV